LDLEGEQTCINKINPSPLNEIEWSLFISTFLLASNQAALINICL